MVADSGLEKLCSIGENWTELVAKIEEYRLLDYSEAYFENRKVYLMKHFGNDQNALALIAKMEFPAAKAGRSTDNKMLKSLSQLSSFMSYFSL